MPITSSNYTAVHMNIVSIGLINCETICIKCDQVTDIVKDVSLFVLVSTETWLSLNVVD